MTLPVLCFGEALIDMLGEHPAGNDQLHYVRFPGGAPANVAVAAALLGVNSALLGKVGDDEFGRFLLDRLAHYGVSTRCTGVSETGKTALAFVSLDQAGERQFAFYDDNAAHRDYGIEDLPESEFERPVIFHFCSGTLASDRVSAATRVGVELTASAGGLVSLDINYRSAFWRQQQSAAEAVRRSLRDADVIKTSREELLLLFGADAEDQLVPELLADRDCLVLVTDGGGPVRYYSRKHAGEVSPPPTEVVDTTAAGDAFIGGLLYQLSRRLLNRDDFLVLLESPAAVEEVVDFASRCGASAVSRKGAFTSLPRHQDLPEL